MVPPVGCPVSYFPHAEHDHLSDYAKTGMAAIVGRVHEDGTADLAIFQPNKEMFWADAVPYGTGPHTFNTMGSEAAAASADNVVALNAGTADTSGLPPV